MPQLSNLITIVICLTFQEFELNQSFWFIVSFLLAFIVVSSWSIILFPAWIDPSWSNSQVETRASTRWIIFLAAVIDIVICVMCLFIFLYAEVQRCCNGNEYPEETTLYYNSDPYGDGQKNYTDYGAGAHKEDTNHSYEEYDEEADEEYAEGVPEANANTTSNSSTSFVIFHFEEELRHGSDPSDQFLYRHLAETYDAYALAEECKVWINRERMLLNFALLLFSSCSPHPSIPILRMIQSIVTVLLLGNGTRAEKAILSLSLL